jgi:hypothetical protein
MHKIRVINLVQLTVKEVPEKIFDLIQGGISRLFFDHKLSA